MMQYLLCYLCHMSLLFYSVGIVVSVAIPYEPD